MKVVIFAGGVGTRLWPLSRKHTPKQFEKIIGDKSTLQLTVERVIPVFKAQDIFISSGERYREVLYKQLPQIPRENFIFEPVMRDVGAAVGLVTAILDKIAPTEPFILLWSDHLVRNEGLFRRVLQIVGDVIKQNPRKIVFIGQRSRFASQNLGWIESGRKIKKIDGIFVQEFKSFRYRPDPDVAEKYHLSDAHSWNPGYFGTTPSFLFSLYKRYAPTMYNILLEIQKVHGTSRYEDVLKKVYPTLEKISFDNLILEKIEKKDGYVLSADLGWSDIGAWESLKEALVESKEENVTRGKTLLSDCSDSLLFNYTDQMVVGIDLNEFLVINTEDVLLVCPKHSVPKIKKLVESLSGTEHEVLT